MEDRYVRGGRQHFAEAIPSLALFIKQGFHEQLLTMQEKGTLLTIWQHGTGHHYRNLPWLCWQALLPVILDL